MHAKASNVIYVEKKALGVLFVLLSKTYGLLKTLVLRQGSTLWGSALAEGLWKEGLGCLPGLIGRGMRTRWCVTPTRGGRRASLPRRCRGRGHSRRRRRLLPVKPRSYSRAPSWPRLRGPAPGRPPRGVRRDRRVRPTQLRPGLGRARGDAGR